MLKLAVLVSHPIQYHAPLYGYLAQDRRFCLKVFYMSDRGARPYYEPLSKTIVKYDNPILEGYDYVFLTTGEQTSWWGRTTEFMNFRLGEELLRFAPDAVYFHGYNNPSFLWAMRRCRRRQIRIVLRGENEDVLPRPWGHTLAREALLKILLPSLDGILYIGTKNREFFLKRGVPAHKLFFVPYAVDNTYFRAGCTPEELTRIRRKIFDRYALRNATRLFIYTHKLRATMRPLDAVRAFANAVVAQSIPAALLMCGDGELRAEAESLAKRSGAVQIVFPGYLTQADLREHMLAADVMINPAQEPWGCSINEGLACGLAMISSDMVVGWPDMVIPGVNGYVYHYGDAVALSRWIATLGRLPQDELERMKQESLRVSRILSFATCADGLAAAMGA